jgi:phage baseplate assembly protein gpV
MAGYPKLVQVIDNERSGRMAYFSDGMVAQYDHTAGIWRPAGANISYEALFTLDARPSARALEMAARALTYGVDD